MYDLQYNGYSLNSLGNSVITDIRGLAEVPIRSSEDPLTGEDGGNIWDQMYDMRTITIEGEIFFDDMTDYYDDRRLIMSAYSLPSTSRGTTGSRELVITRPDGVQRSIYAKISSIPAFRESVGEISEAQYQVTLKAENPFFTDTSAETDSCVLDTPGGSPVYSTVPTPLTFRTDNQMVLTNSGDVPVYPTFTINGEVETATVTKVSTGEYFKIDTTITSSQSVTIYKNTEGFFVEREDGTNMMSYFVGELFQLDEGNNKIIFTASTYSGSATLEVEFYNRYLTI